MFVVKDNKKDAYLKFDRIVDDVSLEIITLVEPIAAYQIATNFDTEARANDCAKTVLPDVYPLTDYTVIDLDKVKEEEEQKAKEKAQAVMTNAWKNTSEETRKQKLKDLYKDKGQEEVEKWLDYVNEPDKQKYLDSLNEPEEDKLTSLLAGLSDEEKEKLKSLL